MCVLLCSVVLCLPLAIYFWQSKQIPFAIVSAEQSTIFRALNTSAIGFKTDDELMGRVFFQSSFFFAPLVGLLVIHFIDSSQILWSNITSVLFLFSV